MSDCINGRKGCDTHGLHYHSPRLEITYSENEVTEKFAALRASNAALLERIALDNAVCLCGCPAGDHEDLGEDGEQCEHEDHECLRVAPAVLAAMQRLRASSAAMREALEEIYAMTPKVDDDSLPPHAKDCPDCLAMKDHPVSHGLCDNRWRDVYALRDRQDHAERAMQYRMRDIARRALARAAEGEGKG